MSARAHALVHHTLPFASLHWATALFARRERQARCIGDALPSQAHEHQVLQAQLIARRLVDACRRLRTDDTLPRQADELVGISGSEGGAIVRLDRQRPAAATAVRRGR